MKREEDIEGMSGSLYSWEKDVKDNELDKAKQIKGIRFIEVKREREQLIKP